MTLTKFLKIVIPLINIVLIIMAFYLGTLKHEYAHACYLLLLAMLNSESIGVKNGV